MTLPIYLVFNFFFNYSPNLKSLILLLGLVTLNSTAYWTTYHLFLIFLVSSSAPSIGSVSAPSSASSLGPVALRELYGNSAVAPGHPLASLVSQQRFLELSRFGLRHYDLAQHMLTQQGAVTKLLGKSISIFFRKKKSVL